MKKDNSIKIYNMLFPIWMLVFLPTFLWLILIPANYLIDRLVLYFSLGDLADRNMFCRRNTWKICLAGFGSDLIGALFLFGCLLFGGDLNEESAIADALNAIGMDPFYSIGSFLLVAVAISIAGAAIYLIDKHILISSGLEESRAKHSALMLAVITAPYLYLIPSSLLYQY